MNYAQYPKDFGLRVPDDHPGMEAFRAYKPIKVPGWYQIVGIVIFSILSMGWISLLAEWGKPVPKAMIAPIMAGLLVIVWISLLGMRIGSMHLMVRQAEQDQVEFKALPDERHVGIAYSDHCWYFRNETSWDRGFLGFQDGSLCFRGFGPSFRLPVNAISRIWITRGAGISNHPNIHIQWIHPVSGTNVFRLEVRDQRTRRDFFKKSEALAEWIENLPKTPDDSESIIWPFEPTALDFGKSPDVQKPDSKDIWAAVGMCALSFGVFLMLELGIRKLFHLKETYMSGLMGVFTVSIFHATVRARVMKKARP